MSDELLHVVDVAPTGEARGTIIAIHGLAESAATLTAAARHWRAAGFRVLAVDVRGHGESPRWTPELLREHPGDVIVRDLERTLDPLVFDIDVDIDHAPIFVYGHSSGGSAAAALAADRIASVTAVVLEDPFWRLPVTRHQDREVAREATANLARLQGMSDRERQAEQASREPQWRAEELPAWSLAKERTDIRLVENGDVIPSTPWPRILEVLHAADIPVLIITGTISIGTTEAHQEIDRAHGAEVLVYEGATHFVRRDMPERFLADVDAFLSRQLERVAKPPVR